MNQPAGISPRFLIALLLLLISAPSHAKRPAQKSDAFRIIQPLDEEHLTHRADASLVGVVDTLKVGTVELTFPVTRSAAINVRSSNYRREGTLAIRSLFDDELQILSLEAVIVGSDGVARAPIHQEVERAEYRNYKKLWDSRVFERWFERVMRDSTVSRMEFHVHGLQVQRIRVDNPAYRQRLGNVAVFRLMLTPGENHFTVNAYNPSGVLIGTWERNLHYQPRLAGLEKPPSQYSATPFHAHDEDLLCSECHTLRPELPDPAERFKPARSCYPCHQKLTQQEYLHGPVATWSCLICHGGDSTATEETSAFAFHTEGREEDVCFKCHTELAATIEGDALLHGPLASGQCTLCHVPHSGSEPALLSKGTVELCVTCHGQRYMENHPVPGHPVQGGREPNDPTKAFSCTSCHSPHSSPNRSLFYTSTSAFGLCKECHPQ